MRLTIDRLTLATALASAAKVGKNLHLEANDDLLIEATDLDTVIRIHVPADIAEPGEIVTPAHIAGVVKTLGATDVEMADENLWAVIASGTTRFRLPGADPEEFPEPSIPDAEVRFGIECSDLLACAERVAYAISNDQSRPHLAGIYCDGERFVVADGHRLAVQTLPGELPAGIYPAKGIAAIKATLVGEVSVAGSPAWLTVSGKGREVAFRLIGGTFPDFAAVIPKKWLNTAIVNAVDLSAMLNRVACVTDTNQPGMTLTFSDDKIVMEATNADIGEVTDEVPAITRGKCALGMNATYMADAVKHLRVDEVKLWVVDQNTPVMISAATEDKPKDFAIIMPMKL